MSEKPTKPMTPRQFTAAVRKALDSPYDAEQTHGYTDCLMEDLLISLGYKRGIEIIRGSERWYA